MQKENTSKVNEIENVFEISTPLPSKTKSFSIPALPGSRTTPLSIRRRLAMRTPLKTPLKTTICNHLDLIFEKSKEDYCDSPENDLDNSNYKLRKPLQEIFRANTEEKLSRIRSKRNGICEKLSSDRGKIIPKMEVKSSGPDEILRNLECKMSSLDLDTEFDTEQFHDSSYSSPVATIGSFVDFVDTRSCGPQTPVRRSIRNRKSTPSKKTIDK